MAGEPNEKDVQLKLRFGDDLRQRLAAAGEKNGSSLNSEIIRRLHGSLAREDAAGSPATIALADTIIRDIAEIEQITGKSWASDAETYGAVRRAVFAAILDRPPTLMNHTEARRLLEDARESEENRRIIDRLLEKGFPFGIPGLDPEQARAAKQSLLDAAAEESRKAEGRAGKIKDILHGFDAATQRGRKLYSEIARQRRETKNRGRRS